MAKDYVRKRQIRQRSNAPRQFIMLIASFLCGYLAATVFDFTSLTTWVNNNFIKKASQEPVKVMPQQADLPKPKFEFYTLLSKDNNVPAPVNRAIPSAPTLKMDSSAKQLQAASQLPVNAQHVTQQALQTAKVVESKPVAVNPAAKDTYFIQIASFNKRPDAEHLKASLVLRGFDVAVVPVNQQNMIWFRVIIGPFSSRQEAERAQATIARTERMRGMIRKQNG